MMNYEYMSDFDINREIAKVLGIKVPSDFAPSILNVDIYNFKMPFLIDNVLAVRCLNANGSVWGNTCKSLFHDYCNNPSGAWPIIVENEINLDPRRTIKKLPWMASAGDQVYSTDKNPLRAAMICFLKMKDAESD